MQEKTTSGVIAVGIVLAILVFSAIIQWAEDPTSIEFIMARLRRG